MTRMTSLNKKQRTVPKTKLTTEKKIVFLFSTRKKNGVGEETKQTEYSTDKSWRDTTKFVHNGSPNSSSEITVIIKQKCIDNHNKKKKELKQLKRK